MNENEEQVVQSAPVIEVGASVLYVNTEGRTRPALIVANHDTEPDSRVPSPQFGHFHIIVFSLTSGIHARLDVPHESIAQTVPDYTVNGQLVGYVK